MRKALRIKATVQPDGKVEIVSPELEAGQTVGRGGAARVQSEGPPRHGNASPLETFLQTGRTPLKARRYEPGMPDMPAVLQRCFNTTSASAVTVQGDLALLDGVLTGFFCSVRCPGDIILKTYDLAKALRGAEMTLIGGFQSPMEKEFLDVLLWGRVNVVICPARGLGNMRVPKSWRAPLSDGRLLILSFFDDNIRRPTEASVARRNAYVAAVSNRILVAHAQQNGKTEALCRHALTSHKPVLTVDSPHNAHLMALGAARFSADSPSI